MENTHIVELLVSGKKLLEELSRAMDSATLSYQNNVDINHGLRTKNKELSSLNDALIQNNEELRQEGQKILEAAKKEADSIISVAKENLLMSAKDRMQAKEEKERVMREVFLERQKIEEMVK